MNDVKKQIMEALKSKGFSKNQVSVKQFKNKFDWDFKIAIIKNMTIPIQQIEEIVRPFEHVRKDFEGEILNGGNVFILVAREDANYGEIPEELINIIEQIKNGEYLDSLNYDGFIIKNYGTKIKLMNLKKLKQDINVSCYKFDTVQEIAKHFHKVIFESNLNEAYLKRKKTSNA